MRECVGAHGRIVGTPRQEGGGKGVVRLVDSVTKGSGESDEHAIEVWLNADGDDPVRVTEHRRLPPERISANGAGIQVHVEDLAAYVAGRERGDGGPWEQLFPAYTYLAANRR